jgi:hypothetical protein
MFEKILEIPGKFWQRLLIMFLAYIGAQIAINLIPIPFMIDNSLLLSIFAILSIIGIVLIPKILVNPFLNYIIVQLMFFWLVLDQFFIRILHISIQPHALIFGLTILTGFIYLLKNFNFLWKFYPFRFYFIFFAINLLYFFCYYSDFRAWGGTSSSQASKTIIFLDSLAVFLSCIIPLSLFANISNKNELNKIVYKTSKILCCCFVSFVLLFPFISENKIQGTQIYLPIYFFLIFGFKYYIDNIEKHDLITTKFSNLMTFVSIILFGITIKNCNKSSLVAILIATLLFIWVNYRLNLKFHISKLLKNKQSSIIYGILLIGLLIFLAVKFNIIGIVHKKLDETFNSLSGGGINSYYIRKSNWRLFFNYWTNHLDMFNCLFGFGLGKSREIIYYISKTQYSPIYLVQTTHNQYIEMFFDYGAMAVFYFVPFVLIFCQNILILMNNAIHNKIKLLSNMSSCLIIFYFIYHYADGLRVPTAIIFFNALMLIEGLKFSLIEVTKKI